MENNVAVVKYAFICTGVGIIWNGYFWPGIVVTGIGAIIAWAQYMDG